MSFVKNQIDPTAIFVQKPEKGDALEIKQKYLATTAGTNNVTLIAGVAGKKIRCIGLRITSATTAATVVTIKNAGSGLPMTNPFPVPANNAVLTNGFAHLEPNILGHFESDLADTVYVDTAAGAGASIYIRYIEITP